MIVYKTCLTLFIISILSCSISSQDFWEYKGLKGTFIGYITQSNSGKLYASEWQGSGDSVFFSDDNGEHWWSYGEINDSSYINISSMVVLDNNDIIASAWGENGGIYKSTDGSMTWTSKNIGLGADDVTKVIKAIDNLFAGTYDGVYLSIDEGETWVKRNVEPDSMVDIRDIAISNDGKLFAADFDDVLRSTDNGISWDTVNNGIFAFNFISLIISETDYLYLGIRRYGIYRSSNLGNSWEQVKPGWIRNLASTSLGYVIAGDEIEGVVISKDNGESWQQINAGLPNSTFINCVFFDQQGYAYCSVHNFGIYKSVSPVVDVNDAIHSEIYSYILYQNFPNPFNPTTRISYSVPEFGFVTLKIYDVLGKEVSALVGEEKSSGSYVIQFDASKLSSGIYFYQLITKDYVNTKKMILIK
ncbi:MAG TPA: T9SS type A sorting domain-containing protein [Ignavibacteriaceae bacterium]|nr:T9SS type A sorting domain-containing protein [Ignavibacteriaceae bacterium]